MMKKSREIILFLILCILIAGLMILSLSLGSVSIGSKDIFDILAKKTGDEMNMNIIFNIRMPRMIAALLLGGALALSGYLLQTFFNNPIAGPFVLGISSGAKLAVALSMIFILSKGKHISSFTLVTSAFIGAMAAMGFVLLISLRVRNMSILVVCGILTGYICSAITDFTVTFADDSNIVNLHNWSMGSFSGINWDDIRIITVITVICFIAVIFFSKPIGAYRMGEEYARSMGVNIRMLRVMLILLSSFLAASVTAFAGPISFVGIAVPHLMKLIFKTTKPLVMIPACFLGGAFITLFCDTIARYILSPTELSVSSVTAVFLVPVVIAMMVKRGKHGRD